MAYETLSLDVTNGIAHVQLIRGDAFNTMNKAFWSEMVQVFDAIGDDHTARVVGFLGNCRNVLHLEGQRPRCLDIDDLGVFADQVLDAGADRRVVIGGLNPEPADDVVAEIAGRTVDAVDHQDVIALFKIGEHGGIDGGQARCEGNGAVTAGYGGISFFEHADVRNTQNTAVMTAFQFKFFIIILT